MAPPVLRVTPSELVADFEITNCDLALQRVNANCYYMTIRHGDAVYSLLMQSTKSIRAKLMEVKAGSSE